MVKPEKVINILLWLSVLTIILSLSIGRLSIPIIDTIKIIISQFLPLNQTWPQVYESVILNLRLPRLILGMLIGAGLASSGAAFQGIFRNPLVSPFILGVASGAGFGGVLGLLFFSSPLATIILATIMGLIAITITFTISRNNHSTLLLVLSGIIVSTFFTALISLAKTIADPIDQLPAIVYWLMGSLAATTYTKLIIAILPITLGIILLNLLRFRINILSMGDETALSLGLNPTKYRNILILTVTIIIAAAVAVSGIIGWVGLVIPHVARMLVGPDHRYMIPASTILGGTYLAIIDTISRSITSTEIPLGILTAIIGAIIFAIIANRTFRQEDYGH